MIAIGPQHDAALQYKRLQQVLGVCRLIIVHYGRVWSDEGKDLAKAAGTMPVTEAFWLLSYASFGMRFSSQWFSGAAHAAPVQIPHVRSRGVCSRLCGRKFSADACECTLCQGRC